MRRISIVGFGILFFSVSLLGSVESPSKDFRTQMLLKTNQLSEELQQFKNRENKIAKEEKESFQKTVSSLDSKWQSLESNVKSLRSKPNKGEQKKIHTQVSSLEHDLDNAENSFTDKQFGLGELLGF